MNAMLSREHLLRGFSEQFGAVSGAEIFFSPGRVNIIGEHLDYNGGMVFPAAISLCIYGVIRWNGSPCVTIRSAGFPDAVTADITRGIVRNESADWGNYPLGVMKYLRDDGHALRGADIYLESTLPDGSGLSSSACIEMLIACMMTHPSMDSPEKRIELALLCRRVENEFIGVNCGIMDQFSIAMGRRGHAILLDAASLEYEHVPLDLGDHSLLIMNTKKPRKLVESKYNERRAECEKALDIIRRHRHIENLADGILEDLEHIDDTVLRKRARHVITENARVLEAVGVLKRGGLAEFGRLMNLSHESLRRDYEVSGPELDLLVDEARKIPGCLGARMTGAGFGGCAVALAKSDTIDAIGKTVGPAYTAANGLSAEFYPCSISDGTGIL
jgi:galactokinase